MRNTINYDTQLPESKNQQKSINYKNRTKEKIDN